MFLSFLLSRLLHILSPSICKMCVCRILIKITYLLTYLLTIYCRARTMQAEIWQCEDRKWSSRTSCSVSHWRNSPPANCRQHQEYPSVQTSEARWHGGQCRTPSCCWGKDEQRADWWLTIWRTAMTAAVVEPVGLNANWLLKTINGEGVSNAGSARIGELPDWFIG